MLGIMELRRTLGRRIDAAHFYGQPTIIMNERSREPRAALVPYSWLVEMCEARGIAMPEKEAA